MFISGYHVPVHCVFRLEAAQENDVAGNKDLSLVLSSLVMAGKVQGDASSNY